MKSEQHLTRVARPLSEIKLLHGEILAAARTSLDKAIRIGELLIKIKSELRHGEWLPWLESNLSFSDRTARNYVRCFEERVRLKSETISNLTDAYRLLEEPKSAPSSRSESASKLQSPSVEDEMVINITIHIFNSRGWPFTLQDVLELRDDLLTKKGRRELWTEQTT
jgi:hypothetical protein